MDRNLAGETSSRFSPTLTESASVELLNLQGRIDHLYDDVQKQKNHITEFENNVKYELDGVHQTLYSNIQDINNSISYTQGRIQALDKIIFNILTLLPVRMLNWFNCFAELEINESRDNVYSVSINVDPLNKYHDSNKKAVRSHNKAAYEKLSRIKKTEENPSFVIIFTF